MIHCVEDDAGIRELIVYTLQTTGFDAQGFPDGASFFGSLQKPYPDLILLDIMLPGEDGIAILKRLKSNPSTREIPVILVTAKGAEYDKVIGLDRGAEDYITKPFGMMELVSRVKAVLRRTMPEQTRIQIKDKLFMDVERHQVWMDGKEIVLTLKEFDLLRFLIEHPGIVHTRDTLLESIWGYDFGGETRTVDVHIHMLRQKLGSLSGTIETVRGIGYRMEDKT